MEDYDTDAAFARRLTGGNAKRERRIAKRRMNAEMRIAE